MTQETIGGIIAVFVIAAMIAAILITRKRKDEHEPPPSSVKELPDLHFDDGAPGIVQVADTGRMTNLTRHRLECDVTFNGFLDANTGDGKEGHFVVQTRSTLANIPAGNFRGIGWIAGSLWQHGESAPFGIGDFTKRACIEDWQNGMKPSEDWPFLKPESVTPALEDGRTYHVVFQSFPTPGGWLTQLQMGDFNSGPVHSDNQNIDPAEQAVAFAALGKGRVSLTNIVSVWS